MKENETLVQTEENINAIPRIMIEGSFIKEIDIEKTLIARGGLSNSPIYRVSISIIDDIGGRHKVTSIDGMVKDKIVVNI